MKKHKSKILIIFLFLLFITSYELLVTSYETFAQETIETLKDKYFQEHNYSGFIDYLKELEKESSSGGKDKLLYRP